MGAHKPAPPVLPRPPRRGTVRAIAPPTRPGSAGRITAAASSSSACWPRLPHQSALGWAHNMLWRKRGRKGCFSCLCSHLPGLPPWPPYIFSQRCFPCAGSPRASRLATASLRAGPPLPWKAILARLSAHALTPSALPLLMDRSARLIRTSLAGSQAPVAPPGCKPPRPSRATGRLHSPSVLRPPVQLLRTATPAPWATLRGDGGGCHECRRLWPTPPATPSSRCCS